MKNLSFRLCSNQNGRSGCSDSDEFRPRAQGLSSMPPRQNLRSGIIGCVYLSCDILIWFLQQFRDSGCENCPFFKIEEDPERIVDVTTPNFNGYDLISNPQNLNLLDIVHIVDAY